MKIELNFYRPNGKWYTKEIIEDIDVDLIVFHVNDNHLYPDMDFTIHIVESDGFLQPYRMFKR